MSEPHILTLEEKGRLKLLEGNFMVMEAKGQYQLTLKKEERTLLYFIVKEFPNLVRFGNKKAEEIDQLTKQVVDLGIVNQNLGKQINGLEEQLSDCNDNSASMEE